MTKTTVHNTETFYQVQYVNSFRRSFASLIDMFIANFIRMIVLTILGHLFIINKVREFSIAFKENFGSEIIGRNPDRIRFLVEHSVFKLILLSMFLVFISGALYHILLNSSKWKATIGKKLMKIIIIKNNGQKLTFLESSAHYFLSIVPWFFTIYIFAYHLIHAVSIYVAITGNVFNLIFGLMTLAWLQIHLITKKKTTVYDMICNTVVVRV